MKIPLEQRLRVYDEVLRLRRRRLTHSSIIDRIRRFHGAVISSSNISQWERGIHHPLGNANRFNPRPSPQLAAVVGCVLSDGNLYHHSKAGRYAISLNVNAREYAQNFGRDLGEVLARKKPYKPRWRKRRWAVVGYSVLLYHFLNRPWQELKLSIEHCNHCVGAFLRAFFDGEGSIRGRRLTIYNTNKALLLYVQRLLWQRFSIEATGPFISVKRGNRFRDPRTSKVYKTKKTCYRLRIRANSLTTFRKYVGFTIKQKRQRLLEATQE